MFEFETRKRSTLAYITLTIITVIGLAGCGGGSTTPELTAEDYLKMGWDSYTAGDYDEAEDYFDQTLELDPAMCDAETGIAWCRVSAEPPQLESADSIFTEALGCDNESADAHAGNALVSLALCQYEDALESADYIADNEGKTYIFSHDPNGEIYWYQIYMVKVQALYYLGDYEESYNTIKTIYPETDYPESEYPFLYLDVNDPAFEFELLYLIELLNEGI